MCTCCARGCLNAQQHAAGKICSPDLPTSVLPQSSRPHATIASAPCKRHQTNTHGVASGPSGTSHDLQTNSRSLVAAASHLCVWSDREKTMWLQQRMHVPCSSLWVAGARTQAGNSQYGWGKASEQCHGRQAGAAPQSSWKAIECRCCIFSQMLLLDANHSSPHYMAKSRNKRAHVTYSRGRSSPQKRGASLYTTLASPGSGMRSSCTLCGAEGCLQE